MGFFETDLNCFEYDFNLERKAYEISFGGELNVFDELAKIAEINCR